MPALQVSSIAKQTGIPMAEAEHRWAKAKTITADEKGLDPSDGDAFWKYVTGVFKKSMGIGEDDKITESIVQAGQKPAVSQDQSRKAMKFTLDTQKNTMEGISRPDVGWIAFLWGSPGREPSFADGDGLARIIAKQDYEKKFLTGAPSGRDLAMRLVDIVTRGFKKRKYGPTSRPKVDFSWMGEIATISWDPGRNTWYLSGWREDWGGILESAFQPILEDAEDDLVNDTNGDIKIKVSTEWKDKIRAATSFDELYAAFRQSGVVQDYNIPFNPDTAVKIFEVAKWLEPLTAEYTATNSAVKRLEIANEVYNRMKAVDDYYVRGSLRSFVPGYGSIGDFDTLRTEAGKEVFENIKAKGAAVVESWKSDGWYQFNMGRRAQCMLALTDLRARQETVEKKYYLETNDVEKKSGFQQAVTDSLAESDNASAIVRKILEEMRSIQPNTPEWVDARGRLDAARAEVDAAYDSWQKTLKEKQSQVYDSDEYKAAVEKFISQSREISAKEKELRQEIKDLDAKIFGSLTDKILESSPITEEQASQWAAGQVLDKSALASLRLQKYLEPDIRKDMAELYRLSGGRFGKCSILPRAKRQPRACAYPDQKNIHIGREFTKKTLWHEMGHLFEGDGKYQFASQAFLDGRVDKSKGLTRLSVLTGNKDYRRDEVAFTDHLFDAYVGKYYRQGVTEVISMGVQQFSSHERMDELLKKDPDMFQVIAGLLATPPSETEKAAFASELQVVESAIEQKKKIDAFYKSLVKKIKSNPAFYMPFGFIDSWKSRKGKVYTFAAKDENESGHRTMFSARNRQKLLQIIYIWILAVQTGGDEQGYSFQRYGQDDVFRGDKIPSVIVPEWVEKLPDIKAA